MAGGRRKKAEEKVEEAYLDKHELTYSLPVTLFTGSPCPRLNSHINTTAYPAASLTAIYT